MWMIIIFSIASVSSSNKSYYYIDVLGRPRNYLKLDVYLTQ